MKYLLLPSLPTTAGVALLLLLLTPPSVSSFGVVVVPIAPPKALTRTVQQHMIMATSTALQLADDSTSDGGSSMPTKKTKDAYDDWYADFDPSDYEQVAVSRSSSSSQTTTENGYGGGGRTGEERRGGGAGSFSDRGGGGRADGRRGGGGGGRGSSNSYGGGGYGGGGGAGGNDYTRDTSRDTSSVDEAAVERLLNDRVAAKKRRDFDTADAIRDQLLQEHAVGVFDKDRTWRTGCSSSGSGMSRGGDRGDRGGRGDRGRGGRGDRFGGRGGDRQGGRGRGGRGPPRDFGPNGHDYYLSEDAGPSTSILPDAEIHELLAERLQAKMSRNFQVADEIQSQLVSSGVFVHDGRKEWRADGVAFGDFGDDGRPGRFPGTSRNDRNRPYVKSVHSPPLKDGAGSDQLVTVLVQERNKYKQLRDFGKADAIREGLRTKFNVLVDDRLREWSVGGDFGPEHEAQREMADAFSQRGYVKSGSSQSLEPDKEAYIQEKVEERAQAKKDRDFDLADSIRDELIQEFDLMINDKLKLWSVGGDFGADGGPSKPRGTFTRRGGGDLTDDQVETITTMLSERYRAKKNRDFDTADNIRDELRDKYNVKIDDKASEWNVDIDEYVQILVPGAIPLPAETVAKIQDLIDERFQSKGDRDYERADEIRDELETTYNVIVDDRTKEWRCLSATSSGNGGEGDALVEELSYADQQFVDGATTSQKSAFKRTQEDREVDSELDSVFVGNENDR